MGGCRGEEGASATIGPASRYIEGDHEAGETPSRKADLKRLKSESQVSHTSDLTSIALCHSSLHVRGPDDVVFIAPNFGRLLRSLISTLGSTLFGPMRMRLAIIVPVLTLS